MNAKTSKSAAKRASISSLFPASADVTWERLCQIETLRYVAAPYASFAAEGSGDTLWREGETTRYHLKLFGFLSFGMHTIRMVQFDKISHTIYTEEHNKSVPVWNHRITLEAGSGGYTRYTDEIEICAGWKTIFVYWWSILFYRHRQKRWLDLLRESD